MTFIREDTFPRDPVTLVPIPIRPVDAATVKVGDKVLLCQSGYVIGSLRGENWWTVEKIGRKWVWVMRTLSNGHVERG